MALPGQAGTTQPPGASAFFCWCLQTWASHGSHTQGALLDSHTAPERGAQRTPDLGPTSNRMFKKKGCEQKIVDTLLSMNEQETRYSYSTTGTKGKTLNNDLLINDNEILKD